MRHFRLSLLAAIVVLAIFATGVLSSERPVLDANNVYLISSASQLAWFRDRVNGGEPGLNARLTQDIDLGGHPWTPIGNEKHTAYSGIFEGNGHYVRGLHIVGTRTYSGLFGCIGDSGMVQDLIIEGAQVAARSTEDFSAGVLAGTTSGVLQNCTVARSTLLAEDLPEATGALYAGAVAGYNQEGIILNTSSVQCKVRTRQSYAQQREHGVGGIVGKNVGTLPGMGLLQNCGAHSNKIVMEVRAKDADASAGGILGLALAGQVRRCSNAGGSVENHFFMGSSAAVGGILGFSPLGSYIENCSVGAHVKLLALGGSAPSSVGGVAGSFVAGNIEGCEVEGVSLQGTGDLPHSMGGLIGTFAGGRLSSCIVKAAELPGDSQAPYRVGAVAGVTFEVEIVDTKPQTLIENTYFEQSIAGGRAVGSDSNPENTNAIPFSKEEMPAYTIDVPSMPVGEQH